MSPPAHQLLAKPTKFVWADSHVLGPAVRTLLLPPVPSLPTLWKVLVWGPSIIRREAAAAAVSVGIRSYLLHVSPSIGWDCCDVVASVPSILTGVNRPTHMRTLFNIGARFFVSVNRNLFARIISVCLQIAVYDFWLHVDMLYVCALHK